MKDILKALYLEEKESFTVEKLLEKLKRVQNKDKEIVIWDDVTEYTYYPGSFHSYRGSYSSLAINSAMESEITTVEDFIKELEEIDWKVFEWYKWWEFQMSKDNEIYFSEYGTASWLKFTWIKEFEQGIVIETRKFDY